MKIALIGYGKMGKAIEEIALDKGYEISLRVGRNGFEGSDLGKSDVAIEFSTPDTAASNILKCLQNNVPVVVGTTAWYHQFNEISEAVKRHNGGLLTATNFSIGVNLFWKVVTEASKLFNARSDYDVSIREIHHLQKLDAPSGTAISTAEHILKDFDRKNRWIHHERGNDPSLEPLHLNIESVRQEGVPGTHEVNFNGSIDSIEIKHTAHSRKGFAIGALSAAEWLAGKKGIFTMDDVLND
jgi:4-hydroxy-tetrahydrodipicolinate reductase